MSEKTTAPSKGIWSKVFTGVCAFVVLAAVPVLALPVLGADIFSFAPAAGEVVQSPLTFDTPTTNLLKVKPVAHASVDGLALGKSDAVLLTKWKDSFDLITALEFGFFPFFGFNFGFGFSDQTEQLLLLTAFFGQQDVLLANASPAMAPSLLSLFTQQNRIIAAFLGLGTTGF